MPVWKHQRPGPRPRETVALGAEVIRRAMAGERAPLGQVLEALYPPVRKHVSFLLGFRADAEEAVQEAMVEILRALPAFRAEAALTTWALRIAGRTAWRHLRSWRRPAEAPADDPAQVPEEVYEVDYEARQGIERLATSLCRIKPKKREAFVLMEVLGMTADEAGAVLKVSPNTAASRCRHARQELEGFFDEFSPVAPPKRE